MLVYNWESEPASQAHNSLLYDLFSALGFELGETYVRIPLEILGLTQLHTC